MSGTRVVLCCGTGGVGKTTTAAAQGVAWALAGKRAAVLTIDPARRLADALGVGLLDNEPREVPLHGLPVPEGGSLHALMVDRKATFDEAIVRLSENPDQARRLLANRYYRAASTRLTGSHEYMATEKLYQLLTSGRFDVIVVDTPPSQHAIEFFHAPERLQELFDGAVVKRLINPGWGLTGGGTRRILRSMLSLLGTQVVEDISEFFKLISGVSTALAAHSGEVGRVLRSGDAHLLLVTTAATVARDGALTFLEQARADGLRVDGFVINRFVSPVGEAAETWEQAPEGITLAEWEPWSDTLRAQAERRDAIAERHRQAAIALSAAGRGAPVWALPYVTEGLRSAEGLAELAAFMPPLAAPTLGEAPSDL